MKMDLYPEKAQYLTGEEVLLIAEKTDVMPSDGQPAGMNELLELRIFFLEKQIRTVAVQMYDDCIPIQAGCFQSEFAGYGAELWKKGTGDARLTEEFCIASTSFDVVDKPSRSIRYGFLSDFDSRDGDDGGDLDFLRKYHINMIQFYDWSFRHDSLVPKEDIYEDMMGKRKDFGVIRKKMEEARRMGMKTLGYGAVYAASESYYREHPEQALYTSCGEPFRFIDIFYIMNIKNNNPWHYHIIEEYAEAVKKAGFDGIHMDTYGFPKTAFSMDKERTELQKEFPGLIQDTKERLSQEPGEHYLIFNNVGNWPVGAAAAAPVDAVYIEVWPPYERYHHIREIIREAKSACGKAKPVILAAYLEPFRTSGGKEPPVEEKAGYSARILTAAIVSLGASHLLMGEDGCVLTQGYYPDYTRMSETLKAQMRSYYDFLIRYMNLFYCEEMQEVTMTHMGWDNYEYQCGFPCSGDGMADRIWMIAREGGKEKSISLINLCGCGDDCWNKGKNRPEVQKELELTVLTDGETEGVYIASPDGETTGDGSGIGAAMKPLAYTCFETDRGKFIRFTVPVLYVWALVYIKGK